MKMNELAEKERHNRKQELIDTANVISSGLGSLASMYIKRIPSAQREAAQYAKEDFAQKTAKYNKSFSRNASRKGKRS